ncbi:class I SAM-dependent methyltransferase [Maribellus sp. CM-23]|uniref:class I SAM-dependent methyltransferase n=1 Tax=Maribellus sp. CM-23 TaxID=2781026 RepID=UPI001F47055F|nr:class I SAM-dependent methyltransferase [Maribellus sp. CM-23]MCE4563246.1 class I SAM-dependent methyltransferase [Maribellus sp. CM-23]
MSAIKDNWDNGDPYEYFMGRWSTLMAREFLVWLNAPLHTNWLDVGCGTGALSKAIEQNCSPQNLTCLDPSSVFIEKAKERISMKAAFTVGSVENMPFENENFDIVVSGLALNFFPKTETALAEIKRVLKPGGVVGAYVWDYSGRMDFLRHFWDAAYQIDPKSKTIDEGIRFPICSSNNLIHAFQKAGFAEIESSYLCIDTLFINFEDYWNPFLGGQGPAPGYLLSLSKELQEDIKNNIQERLNCEPDGSIKLLGRAIAIKGKL